MDFIIKVENNFNFGIIFKYLAMEALDGMEQQHLMFKDTVKVCFRGRVNGAVAIFRRTCRD